MRKGYSKKGTNSSYNNNNFKRNRYDNEEIDLEDDEERYPRNKQKVANKGGMQLDILGKAVTVSSLRGEVYHDDDGRRVYGSWK